LPEATGAPLAAAAGVLRVSAHAEDAALDAELRAHGLALKGSEARTIAATLGRDPTLVEAHAFDAQWSEHCSYKSSRHYLKRLPTDGPTVLQGPQEDAGIVRLGAWQGKTYGIVFAHESHNHPSQVVPFEGAATGIGGIVRDVLCMGARVIAVADPLRFGPLDDPHCRYVAQGVVDGIAAYGNAIGVPNIAGDVFFHDGFRDNCLVNVVALGLIEATDVIHSAAPPEADGWDIVLVGKATDRSGFGGAAFSSLVLDEEDAEQNKGAVQVPDPFLKNVIMRASYRVFDVLRERGLTVGFKDLGAGGIMGCTAELVASGGFGAIVDLDRCPTSQERLPPAVIAVGETQERLAWVVPPSFTPELLAIYNDEFSLPQIARGAQAAVIGTVTKERRYVLRHGGGTAMDVDIDFLTGGIRYDRPTAPTPIADDAPPASIGAAAAAPGAAFACGDASDDERYRELQATLERLLAHRDVCSRRPIYERYDSVVRGTTAIPCGYGDAGLIVPVEGAPLGCALGLGGNPRLGALDARLAAEDAVVEAIRNVAAVGARAAALTDCLNFGNPEVPQQMGELVAAIDGLAHAARELAVPFVSGNVSLYNTAAGGTSIPASPIVACVGTLDDVSFALTPALTTPGSALYLIGGFGDALGASVFADVFDARDRRVARFEYAALRGELGLLDAANRAGLVTAAHDVSDGGLLVALAEMAFAAYAPLGVRSDVACPCAWTRGSAGHLGALFGERSGFVVEVRDAPAFDALAAARGLAHRVAHLGTVTAEPTLALFGHAIPVARLRDAWSLPLRDFYADALAETAG
jgi:phosphoribosylformylglycinamidine synthase II